MKAYFWLFVLSLSSFEGFSQFTEKQVGGGLPLSSIFMSSSSTGYVGGGDGIFKTTNGGQNWTLAHSKYLTLDSIYFKTMGDHHLLFLNDNVGYSVGWGGMGNYEQIIKTIDGGATWTMQHRFNPDPAIFQSSELRLQDIYSLSDNILVTVGYRGRILKTINGGTNWSAINSTTTANLNTITFANTTTGIIGGQGIILFTTDGGNTWVSKSSSYSFEKIVYLTDQELIATTNYNVIKSYDGGQTWSTISIPAVSGFYRLSFLNGKIGFIGGENFILKTTDGGATFEKFQFSSSSIYGIHAVAEQKILMATYQGKVIYSDGSIITYSPIAYFEVSGDTPCINQSISATNKSAVGYTYTWYVDNVVVGNTYNLSYAFPAAGTRTLKLAVSNGVKIDTYSRTITVRDAPLLPPYQLQATGATTVCQGDPVILSVKNLYTSDIYSLYDKTNAVVGNVGMSGSIFYFNASTTVHINLQATNDCGTRSGADSLKITIVPKPAATIQAKADKTSVCSGDSTFIEIQNSQVGMTYFLTEIHGLFTDTNYQTSAPGNGGTLRLYTPALTTVAKTYDLTAKNSLGCSKYYTSYYINIRSFSVDFSVGPRFPALNNPITITNTSTADTYEWDFGANASPATSTLATPVASYSQGGEKIIKLKGIVKEGCFKTAEKKVWVMNTAASTTLTAGPKYSNLLDSTYRVTEYKLVNGNHYMAGYISSNTSDFSTYKFFIAKFNSVGTLQWLNKRLDLETTTSGKGSAAQTFFVDGKDNIYVSAYFCGNNFSIGDSVYVSKRIDKPHEVKGMLLKLNAQGKIRWGNLFEVAEVLTDTNLLSSYRTTFAVNVTPFRDSLFVSLFNDGPEPVSLFNKKETRLRWSNNAYNSLILKLDTLGHYSKTVLTGFINSDAQSYTEDDRLYTVDGGYTSTTPATMVMDFGFDYFHQNKFYPPGYSPLENHAIVYLEGPNAKANHFNLSFIEPDRNTRYFSGSFRFLGNGWEKYMVLNGDTTLISDGSIAASHDKLQRLNWLRFMPYADVVDSKVIGTDLFLLGNYRGTMGAALPGGGYKALKAPTTDASMFLAKYDANGILQWINNIDGGAGNDVAYGLEKIPCSNDLIILASRSTGVSLITYSLDQDLPAETCFQAAFKTSFPDVATGESVQFTDISTGTPTTWQWTFEGGNVITFNGQTPPAITYATPGKYKISLTVSAPGKSSTRTLDKYISVHKPLVAKFTASKTEVMEGDYVDFTSTSEGDPLWWSWYFDGAGYGFGEAAGYENPKQIHYPVSGRFYVQLKIARYGRSAQMFQSGYINVQQKIVPNFSASQTSVSTGQQVNFTNLTQGSATSYEWTFAGGTPATSADVNPSVTYAAPGTYSVTLRAKSSIQNEVKTITGYIVVTQKLVADFTASKTKIDQGEAINFTSLALGGPLQFDWSFQGGTPSTSTSANPSSIAYAVPGIYKVSLKVTNSNQTDTKTVDGYITVGPPLVANFGSTKTNVVVGESISFTDLSQGSPASWLWTFEGASPAKSTAMNPSDIRYSTPGIFDVNLTATRTGETNSKLKTGFITVYPLLIADFLVDKTEINLGDTVHFQNLSSAGAESYLWTFEGAETSTSTAANPDGVIYNALGEYTVTLKVTANIQTKETVKEKLIKVTMVTGLPVKESELIEVYPNPSSGTFVVKGIKGAYSLELFNILGLKITTADNRVNETELHAETGIYILKVTTETDEVYFCKVIVK